MLPPDTLSSELSNRNAVVRPDQSTNHHASRDTDVIQVVICPRMNNSLYTYFSDVLLGKHAASSIKYKNLIKNENPLLPYTYKRYERLLFTNTTASILFTNKNGVTRRYFLRRCEVDNTRMNRGKKYILFFSIVVRIPSASRYIRFSQQMSFF